jgi:outer membrane protein TolC
VLREIEKNNPTLEAAAAEMETERLDAKSEALLSNPEVEFNYLWGAENMGTRHDLRVSQSFDIPTITGMRSGMVASMNELSRLKYDSERLSLLQEARGLCVDMVYLNSLLKELYSHLERSRTLVDAYEKRMKAGGATVLDLNKAKLHLTAVQGEVNKAETERRSALSRLTALNGGNEIAFDSTSYDLDDSLPIDFETWFKEAVERNPVLEYVRKEVEVGQKQLSIDKTSRLPDLSVGYMSELRTAEKFRGVTVGMSIPLWSSSNKIKRSRAEVAAAESRAEAATSDFYHRLRNLYMQASALKANSEMMRRSLSETDNRDYLVSALSKGEISMIDYLVETDLYYEALKETLAAERDYRHALASLKVF